MSKELKEEIADYFLSDSSEFLKRYKVLEENQTHIGNRSKLLIDIIFSLECSLKALIFLESTCTVNETYQKIIKAGHDLKKLLKMVDKSSIPEIATTIDENFQHFSISSRYTLDANIYFRGSSGGLGELYYSTIANPIWLENIYKKALNLFNYTNSKIDRFKTISFCDIDINKELDDWRQLLQLNKKIFLRGVTYKRKKPTQTH